MCHQVQKSGGGITKVAHQQGSRASFANVFMCLGIYPLEIKDPIYSTTAKALHKGLCRKAKRRNLVMLNESFVDWLFGVWT